MNLLGIDTSTGYAGIALQFDGGRHSETWHSDHNHGVELLPRLSAMMSAAGCSPADLDCIAVALGPGGFSAVRVGVSCAQGLAAPLSGAVVTTGVPTHYLQARSWTRSNSSVDGRPPAQAGSRQNPDEDFGSATQHESLTSVIPIGRGQVSWAEFRLPLAGISNGDRSGIWDRDEMEAELADGRSALCGEAVAEFEDRLGCESQSASPRPPDALLDIAHEVNEFGGGAPVRGLELPLRPLYAREPTITRRK